MKKLLLSLLVLSLGYNVFLFTEKQIGSEKFVERSLNRPFIESFLMVPCEDKSLKSKVIFEILLLDSMGSGYFEPINDDFRVEVVDAFKQTCNDDEISTMLNDKFDGVNLIKKDNALFFADGDGRFIVMGGSSLVDNNYSGTQCLDVINRVKANFLKYLGD